MQPGRHDFQTLEDFLISSPLHADGQLDDGWGASFPVKGREIEATVLFADITGFSTRTSNLSPAETLVFVNNFFAWVSAEAIRGGRGIVDKYIGDEVMIIYSREFGSEDPFVDAVQAARWMAQNDAHSFVPHVGIASGRVIVGYTGTPARYSCSVFGAPVVFAARCAKVKPEGGGPYGATVVFPANEWADRDLRDVIPSQEVRNPDGTTGEQPFDWELLDPRNVTVKRTSLAVRELVRTGIWITGPGGSPEDRARDGLASLKEAGLYRPDLPF